MKIEHNNYVVKEPQKSIDFILAAFPKAKIRGQGDYDWFGQPRQWFHVGTDDCYLALSSGGTGEIRDFKGSQVGLAHVGFEVDDLDACINRLSNAGFELDHYGQDIPARKNVYYFDPNGLEVEFVQYFTDDHQIKNKYD